MRKRSTMIEDPAINTDDDDDKSDIAKSRELLDSIYHLRVQRKATMLITCALCVFIIVFVMVCIAASGHLGRWSDAVRAKQAIEREFGVNPHYAMHYFSRHAKEYKCVESHHYSTRQRASWCVPDDADVHDVTKDELRWMPPRYLFFEDGSVFGMPGENASVRESWRSMESRTAGLSYCLPPRSVRVRHNTDERHAGPCPRLMRCAYVGAPLMWDEFAAGEQFQCTPMKADVSADAHSLWHPIDMHDVVEEVRILCKRNVGEMHYAPPNVHSTFSDCSLTYERNERASDV